MGAGGDSGPTIPYSRAFRYRSTTLWVDPAFVSAYFDELEALYADYETAVDAALATETIDLLGYGLVSSVKDTIDEFWGPLLARTPQWQAYEDRIGCYDLPRGGRDFTARYSFWRYGAGAPRQVHLWTAQVLYVFWAELSPHSSTTPTSRPKTGC